MARKRKTGIQAGGWEGGDIRIDSKGVPTYIIARMIAGRRYRYSTRAHTLEAAKEHLKRFEADPEGYSPRGTPDVTRLWLTEEMIERFVAWGSRPKTEGGKGNTEDWTSKQRRILLGWLESYGATPPDLRKEGLQSIERWVNGPGRQHRIAVVKAFYAWLRQVERSIDPQDDPTLHALKSVQSTPEQWRTGKAFSQKDFDKMMEHLEYHKFRSAALVQMGTGWHCQEVCRFASSGRVAELPAGIHHEKGERLLECPRAKSGKVLRTVVSSEVAEAAADLLKEGSLDYHSYWAGLKRACLSAGLPRDAIQPGNFRHSVATIALENGTPIQAVSDFLGHENIATTRRFYATLGVARKIHTIK